ncbi:MAG TPA: hypothetical protein VGN81_23250 [Pseudonocardiaceae bacterium]|jgi:hypothetical protein
MSAALVAGTAACGGSITGSGSAAPAATTTTTAPAALQASDVVTAINNATAVHVKGTLDDSGSTITMDVQINKDAGASGTIAIGGPTYPIVFVDKVVYIQFTPDVIKSSGIDPTSAAGTLLSNKWVPSTSKILAGSDLASSVEPLLDYTQFATEITKNIPTGPVKAGKSDTVDGTPVVEYTFSDGTPADIATTSPHYLMRLLPGPKDGAGQLDFTGWSQPVPVQAPSASEIFTG